MWAISTAWGEGGPTTYQDIAECPLAPRPATPDAGPARPHGWTPRRQTTRPFLPAPALGIVRNCQDDQAGVPAQRPARGARRAAPSPTAHAAWPATLAAAVPPAGAHASPPSADLGGAEWVGEGTAALGPTASLALKNEIFAFSHSAGRRSFPQPLTRPLHELGFLSARGRGCCCWWRERQVEWGGPTVAAHGSPLRRPPLGGHWIGGGRGGGIRVAGQHFGRVRGHLGRTWHGPYTWMLSAFAG